MSYDANGNFRLDGYDAALTDSGANFGKGYNTSTLADSMPKSTNIMGTQGNASPVGNTVNSGFFDKMFESPSGTVGAIGSVISGIGSVYAARMQKEYQDKIFKMEKDRVDRANATKDAQNAALAKVWS